MRTKNNRKIMNSRRLQAGVFLAVATCVTVGLSLGHAFVGATSLQQQINDLNAKNAQNQSQLNSLQLQATSYQDAINKLRSQITAIHIAIAASQAQEASLQTQMAQEQADLLRERTTLAADLKAQYVNGDMSTAEMLASSQDLTTFVDAETYREAVQAKIQDTLTQIKATQAKLAVEKTQVDGQLTIQKQDQATLDQDETVQASLLSANEGQQASFNKQIASNNAQISRLRAEQAAANASIARTAHVVGSSGGSGGACDIGNGNGGYPMSWCDAGQDSFDDANGFPVRECTSFAYWYFTSVEHQTGFSVSGNAGWWWETSNYPVTQYPDVKVGAIGVEPSSSLNAPVPSLHGGYYGHVMIVKALPGQNYPGYGTVPDGYVLVSSMNEDEAGHFMFNLWPVNYLMYINPQ